MKPLLRYLFCYFALMFCFLCSSYGSNFKRTEPTEENDSSIISRKYLDIIENSDSVIWYLLDPMSEDTISQHLNNYGEILLVKTDTLYSRCGSIKKLLTEPSSFKSNAMVKESTFLPDVAVCFFSEDGVLIFSYSFYCDLCHFECNGKYQEVDGEIIRKSIINIANEVFPNDRYLRHLRRREK